MIKAILLDLDDTLYDYQSLHKKAIENVANYVSLEWGVETSDFYRYYKQANQYVKKQLPEQAASHNRMLYMQRVCEILNKNALKHGLHLYNLYWDKFLELLQLPDATKKFLEKYKHLTICLVTDLTAHIQFRKIEKLGLDKYIDSVVTSEEVGHEKPNEFMFLLALKKLKMNPDEVCMIGDSYKKDIAGAIDLGIKAYWLNKNQNDASDEITGAYEVVRCLTEIVL